MEEGQSYERLLRALHEMHREMEEERSYKRLLQALHNKYGEMEERIRPVEEQIVQAEDDRLKSLFEQQRNALAHCLERIDQKILECRLYLMEYNRVRADLSTLNERLCGAQATLVQRFAGHSNVSTTARYDGGGQVAKRKADELLHMPYGG